MSNIRFERVDSTVEYHKGGWQRQVRVIPHTIDSQPVLVVLRLLCLLQ